MQAGCVNRARSNRVIVVAAGPFELTREMHCGLVDYHGGNNDVSIESRFRARCVDARSRRRFTCWNVQGIGKYDITDVVGMCGEIVAYDAFVFRLFC